MPQDIALDPSWTVNETIARHPATMAVFNRFGIDTCCGSGVAVSEAAHRDEIALHVLLDALRQAAAEG